MFDNSFMNLFSLTISLFLLLNSIGNMPVFLAALKGIPPKRQQIIIIREMCVALGLMLLFSVGGSTILELLNISQPVISISGGVILFLIALKMIFPEPMIEDASSFKHEPFIVPLAIPVMAGPGTLTTIMVYSHQEPSYMELFGAIMLAWLASTLLLLSSSAISRFLGEKILTGIERMMGMVLTLIAVEMFVGGIFNFIALRYPAA